MTFCPGRERVGDISMKRVPRVKTEPRYELAFALDDRMTESVFASASDSLSRKGTIDRISDFYYEKRVESGRAKAKSARRNQYRIRHLVLTGETYLERLRWEADLCSLRQTAVSASQLSAMGSKDTSQPGAGKWFCKRLVKHNLVPSLQTHFERTTWTGDSPDGVNRLTLDENIQAECLREGTSKSPIRLACNILRMSFADSMPARFKSLIYQFALLPKRHTVVLDLARAQVAREEHATLLHAPHVHPEANACLFG
jgi:hypothetical protein